MLLIGMDIIIGNIRATYRTTVASLTVLVEEVVGINVESVNLLGTSDSSGLRFVEPLPEPPPPSSCLPIFYNCALINFCLGQ